MGGITEVTDKNALDVLMDGRLFCYECNVWFAVDTKQEHRKYYWCPYCGGRVT